LFFKTCGAKQIIGTPFKKKQLKIQVQANGFYESECQRLANRLKNVGAIDLADPFNWNLCLSHAELDQGKGLLPASNNRRVTISIGTKQAVNHWGENNWTALIQSLSKAMPETILVLVGADDEFEASERLRQAWIGTSVNLCGKTAPRILAAVLELMDLFIGHDSGPMHLAAASGTKVIGLFSWKNPPGRWSPGHSSWPCIKVLYPELPKGGWNQTLRFKHGPEEGILKLKPEMVFQAAMELWQAT
jgi:ADP-heptose:LPS heptosyltransferase